MRQITTMRRPSGYVVGKSKGGHHQRLLTSMRRQEQCGQKGKGGHQQSNYHHGDQSNVAVKEKVGICRV
jgi:hypothetical protein